MNNLNANFGGLNFYPVAANTPNYTPVLDYPTTWVDRDILRSGGILNFNKKLIGFLSTLESIEKNPQTGQAKTINGVGEENYRPHFTLFKAVLPAGKDALEMPSYQGATSFKVHVAVGKSKLTGEFVEIIREYS